MGGARSTASPLSLPPLPPPPLPAGSLPPASPCLPMRRDRRRSRDNTWSEKCHSSTDDFLPLDFYELKVLLLGKLQGVFKEQGVTDHLKKDWRTLQHPLKIVNFRIRNNWKQKGAYLFRNLKNDTCPKE